MDEKKNLKMYQLVCQERRDRRKWRNDKSDDVVLRYWSGIFWYGLWMDLCWEGRCCCCGTQEWRWSWLRGDWKEALVQDEAIVELKKCRKECAGRGVGREEVEN